MVSQSQLRDGSSRGPRRLRWLGFVSMPCVFVAMVMADEAQPKAATAPPVKKAAVKKAAAKQEKGETKKPNKTAGKKKKEKKPDAPTGYEDAPEAGDPPPVRAAVDVAVADFVGRKEVVENLDVVDVEKILAINVDANVANIEKQFSSQFKPLLTAELSFINRACDLNLQQRKKIKAASDKCLKATVRKYAMTQNGMMRGGGRQSATMDPTELLHLALGKILKETLQPEQLTTYEDEMATRRAHRTRVAIENVVALIDERLVLTIDQRKKLTESLDKNWQASWVQSLEMLINNNQYLPSIPDRYVVSALNETQKKVWRATQKQNFMVWGGFGLGQQVQAVDDFPLVEVEVEAVVEKTSVN